MLSRVEGLSQAVRAARRDAIGLGAGPQTHRLLEEARWRVLRAETSCNFFWGQDWLPRCADDLDEATRYLNLAGGAFC
jgi:hypothetical protein